LKATKLSEAVNPISVQCFSIKEFQQMGHVVSCFRDIEVREVFVDIRVDSEIEASMDPQESAMIQKIRTQIFGPAQEILSRYQGYEDCHELIAEAIRSSAEESVHSAFEAVLPSVLFQKEVFDFSAEIANAFRSLTLYIVSLPFFDLTEVLPLRPVTARTVADLFELILAFDEHTVLINSKILADLSFFRRNVNRRPNFQDYESLYAKSWDISVFFAGQSPFLAKVISTLRQDTNEIGLKPILNVFSGLCNAFTLTVRDGFSEEHLCTKCFRTIVGSILCYDHLNADGAFHKKSGIKTLEAVECLDRTGIQAQLLKLLKFGSKHYSDPTTQKQISAIIK
jgi:hypothetical protein